MGDQIGVGAVELHTVIARLLAADGGGDELLLHPLDVLQGHLPGHLAPGRHGDTAGAQVLPTGEGAFGGGAAVVELGENLGAVGVDGAGQLLRLLDVVVLGHPQVVLGGDGVHVVHSGVLVDDEADATLGPLSVIGDQTGCGVAPNVRQVCAHGGHDGPIPDGEAADAARFKELFVRHGSALEIAVVAEVTGIGHWGDGRNPAVGVVEEAGHKGGLQDLVVVEARLAQVLDLGLVDLVGVLGDIPGILAQGILLLRQQILGGAEVVAELIHQHGILGIAPQRIAVGGQAVGAAVDGGDYHADHLFVRVGEVAGVRVEQGSLEVQEADVLGCVQRQDLEQVVDKAPVLLHGLHVLVKDGIF
ncbi:S-methyl-5-thioribose-1-phosphate isomerase, partial [Dysosmobacter welbionis]